MRGAIVERALDPAALLAEVASESNGAAVLFVGTVRDVNDGRPVVGLEYSGYVSMAERELAAIVAEAARRARSPHVVVEHRVGSLALGEAAVVVAVACPHREPAFETARWVIDELKRRVPIWKREHYTDGARAWVDPTRVTTGERA